MTVVVKTVFVALVVLVARDVELLVEEVLDAGLVVVLGFELEEDVVLEVVVA